MEKRQFMRREIFAHIDVEFDKFSDKKSVKALMYNISQGGINFIIKDDVKHGDQCKISIGKGEKKVCIDGYVKAIQFMDGNNNSCKAGVQFFKEIDKNQFHDVVAMLNTIGFN